MMQAYLEHGLTDAAVFELFFRRLPENRNFLMAAGLRQVVDFLSGLRFGADELQWIKDSGRFSGDFADYLANLRFTGDVDAVAEGTLFFADEPVVRIVASVAQAQLVETRVINAIHFQSVIASKAARMVLAAKGRTLIDFGLRLDSGDLDALAREVRRILDAGGLADVQVFPSGGIDERAIARFVDGGAPIDGFGVGTSLVTSQDSPALDCAYKLQEYAGLARRKHSAGKATWPGRKQVCRRHDSGGRMAGDTLTGFGMCDLIPLF